MEPVATKTKEKKFTGCSTCGTSGCNKLNVFDWLGNMTYPSNEPKFNIIEVRFKGSRKHFYRNETGTDLIVGDMVVVETGSTGHDVGSVSLTGELVKLHLKKYFMKEDDENIRKIFRKANERDLQRYEEAKAKEAKTLQRAREIALHMGLKMKLSDIEFQGDGNKAIFFYTAEERVDFRELIKKYAEEFKIRIEMRQISYRNEASRLGAIGSCGRELCCSTWLTDFKMVATAAARYQNLSLNPLKLSGQCGRLKCCLNFELDTYVEALSEFPNNHENLKIESENGIAKWLKTDILKRMMWFAYEKDMSTWIPLQLDTVKEIIEFNKQGVKPADFGSFVVKPEIPEEPVFDYENVVGQDDINRMDNKDKKKKKKSRNKNRPRGPVGENPTSNNNPSNTNPRPNNPRPNNPRNNNSRNNNPRPPADPNRPKQPPQPPRS